MKKVPLHWKIIIGLVVGIAWAIVGSYFGFSKFTVDWILPWGTIFINLLKLIAVPLVLFSIIYGIAGLSEITKLGRVGVKTLVAYLFTTVLAVTIGLTIVNIYQPGNRISEDQRIVNRIDYELWVLNTDGVQLKDDKSFLNDPQYASIVAERMEKKEWSVVDPNIQSKIEQATAQKAHGPLQFLVDMVPSNIFFSLNNNQLMLQVIFFAIFFGITIITISRKKAKAVIRFVGASNEIFLKMVDIVMQGAPFFVFALMAGTLADMSGDNPGGVIETLKGLGFYSIAVVFGLGLIVVAIYPLIMALFVRKISYKDFFRGVGPAQLLAFTSSSSAATLPVTMDCVRENLGVSKPITSFVLPIGATVNMDGTSLYQAIAVVFLAQMHFIDLTIGQQLIIILTATLASIGSAAVPSAGLVMLVLVLGSVDLNPAWIAIIFPVDRILDMCRTVVNVTGDATVASVIAKSEGELNFTPKVQIDNFEV